VDFPARTITPKLLFAAIWTGSILFDIDSDPEEINLQGKGWRFLDKRIMNQCAKQLSIMYPPSLQPLTYHDILTAHGSRIPQSVVPDFDFHGTGGSFLPFDTFQSI